MDNIIKKIDEVPALPKTILNVMELSNKEDKSPDKLIDIIKYDPMIVSMLIKTANSALFGYKNKIETIENLVYLLGIELTTSLVLSQYIQSSFDIDFSPYGIDVNQFRDNTMLKVNLLSLWLKKVDINLKKELLLPMTILNIGKFIISDEIIRLKQQDKFLAKVKNEPYNLESIEKEFCGYCSVDVTILLLEHWDMGDKIIDNIKNSIYIKVVDNICNIVDPLNFKEIDKNLKDIEHLGYDIKPLKDAIMTIEDRL